MPSLTRLDAFRQWSGWQLTQCPYTHIAQPSCLASLLLPREEGCSCTQLAARCRYIWRSSESGQRRQKHQVSAEPKVGFQVKLMLYVIQTGFSKITMRNLLLWAPRLSFPPWMTTLPWHPCIGKNQYSQEHNEETEAEPLVATKQAGCNAAGVLQACGNHLSCQNYFHLHGKTFASSSPWQRNGSSTGQSQWPVKANLPLRRWQIVRCAGHREGSVMPGNNRNLSAGKII